MMPPPPFPDLLDLIDERSAALRRAVAAGERSASESLGHQEFILTYKSFDPVGPACQPVRRAA